MTTSIFVLVVEDQDSIRQILEEALTDGGFTVTPASNGEEAMTILKKSGADYLL